MITVVFDCMTSAKREDLRDMIFTVPFYPSSHNNNKNK